MLNIASVNYTIVDMPGYYRPKSTLIISDKEKTLSAPKIAVLQNAKVLSAKFKLISTLDWLQRIILPISTIILIWGTYLTIYQVTLKRTSSNVILFMFYAVVWGIWLSTLLKRRLRNFGVVTSAKGPVSRAVIRIFDQKDHLVSTTVSDKSGKFALMLPKGEYKLKAASSTMAQKNPVKIRIKDPMGPISAKIYLKSSQSKE